MRDISSVFCLFLYSVDTFRTVSLFRETPETLPPLWAYLAWLPSQCLFDKDIWHPFMCVCVPTFVCVTFPFYSASPSPLFFSECFLRQRSRILRWMFSFLFVFWADLFVIRFYYTYVSTSASVVLTSQAAVARAFPCICMLLQLKLQTITAFIQTVMSWLHFCSGTSSERWHPQQNDTGRAQIVIWQQSGSFTV